MAAQPLVYVHGAGKQRPAGEFKAELDQLLFGQAMATTRVAHYSDVRWPPTPTAGGPRPIGPGRPPVTRRERAVRRAARPDISAEDAAAEVVGATLARPGARGGRAAAPDTGRRISAADMDEARRLAEELYRRADRVARMSSSRPRRGLAAGPSFPDFIFRRIVGFFASDVIDYLYGGFADRMRAPVREALLRTPTPKVIIAHSLGTIVLYDVLNEPALRNLKVNLLVTVGSPLGIGNVQDRLRDRAGRPNPVPASLKEWANFGDRWDPVALDATLRDAFEPPKDFATDEAVNNRAQDNHALVGYLSIGAIQSLIRDAAEA